jgi:hypothetical protein
MSFPKPDYSDLSDYHANWASWTDIELFIAQKMTPDLAITFMRILFPEFYLIDDCVFRSEASSGIIEGWKASTKGNLAAIERVINHVHIAEDHRYPFVENLNDQNLKFFAYVLKETWKAALAVQFPDRVFIVNLHHDTEVNDYIITFWQPKHDKDNP